MDRSKPGRGILASLEHKAAETPRYSATTAPSRGRGAALIVAGGVLIGALLAWWLSNGPSPVIVHEALPPFAQAAPPRQEPAPMTQAAAAAIVDDVLPPVVARPPAVSPSLIAVLGPAPVTPAVMRRDRVAMAQPKPKPKPGVKQFAVSREQAFRPARTPADTDVALLSALVAHANDHDVVEARAGDSAASLLQRCRRVGGEEGRLCAIRICATRAGDAACHAD
ncbi:hypothetical protein [Pseudoduganella umbonata]|uniref:Uncharacterized protein n=1 Tax=Pseudoduganella umbonata TaxID=864828 RepID=A0A4P8HR93_9BURK|nr:hypothetical protein [Pseudoduganella umbonata]MBB3224824.1 hypothetical protein [Pseudoduganella umbonata]QCP11128.1 hypothetical protein FCL38_12440 [Pseudoduganella umbonata]